VEDFYLQLIPMDIRVKALEIKADGFTNFQYIKEDITKFKEEMHSSISQLGYPYYMGVPFIRVPVAPEK
jgi:hypothetical protein